MEVTAWTFEEKVDNAPKDVFTVMHIYQDVKYMFYIFSFYFLYLFGNSNFTFFFKY